MGAEIVEREGRRYAEYLPATARFDATRYFSQPEGGFQFGVLVQPRGHAEPPHRHLPMQVGQTGLSEFIFVQAGSMTISFFSDEGETFREIRLQAGDAIVLLDGAHAYRIDEDAQAIIVKQGPLGAGGEKIAVGRA